MKTVKEQIREEIKKFHKDFGYNQELRDKIQQDLRDQDETELWELQDAVADFNNNFNYKIQ